MNEESENHGPKDTIQITFFLITHMKIEYCRYTTIYLCNMYLCFICKKGKMFLPPRINFCPLKGESIPIENIRKTNLGISCNVL